MTINRIQDNINEVNDLLDQIKSHPMCLEFKEYENKYLVIYPEGMCIDGAQADKGRSKSFALKRLLNAMEQHWKQSGINRK